MTRAQLDAHLARHNRRTALAVLPYAVPPLAVLFAIALGFVR